ncbi:MAG: DUF3618 domain-containing protein [Hyphomicrobiaceae bacterium]|nr:DUF3618 domain-containing protein [Hyphomicrobiaceae bacterium]
MTETPGHAEREVERARADLSHTLDALRDRLSFGHIFDEVRTQVMGSNGGEFVSNLSRQVRDNPMPTALIGLGVLWLMMSERDRAAGRSHAVRVYPGMPEARGGRPGADGIGERAQQAAAQMGMTVQETAEQGGVSLREAGERAKESVRTTAAGAGESMRAMAGAVGEQMSVAGDTMRTAAGSAREYGAEAAHMAGESASQLRERTMQGFNTMLEQQPLVLGAIGVALGAVVGAMLPITRIEDEYMGETRDQLRDAIAEQGGQLYEKGKVTATEVYRSAAEEARAQGLMPGEEGKSLAERAEQVLSKAGETAREAGQREIGAAGEPTRGSGQTAGESAASRQPPESTEPGSPVKPDRSPSQPRRQR